jgi:glycosyltransferase involved in cell wall biosynthesis
MNLAALERRVRGADLVTTVSNFVTNHIRREFPSLADRCETSYNGIDANEFVCEKDYAAARERTEKRLLFVGAVSPHSGVHVLMEAFKAVVSMYPEVHLNIVGPQANYPLEELFDLKDQAGLASVSRFYSRGGDSAGYLSHLKAQLPPEIARKVTFFGEIGVRSRLVEQYYGAEVFVFPPVCDHGFGLPPVEAMAAGTPCVATRAGAIVETVKNNETGILVDKNDPKPLAQAIVNLLENDQLREAMGRAARRRVFEHFTWDKAARRIFDRYSDLCEMRATPADRSFIGLERKMTDAGKRGITTHAHEIQLGRWSRFRLKVRGRSLSETEAIDP